MGSIQRPRPLRAIETCAPQSEPVPLLIFGDRHVGIGRKDRQSIGLGTLEHAVSGQQVRRVGHLLNDHCMISHKVFKISSDSLLLPSNLFRRRTARVRILLAL